MWRLTGPDSADLQVGIIHRPKYDDWSFPKGKLEPGEHVLRAAVREVAEETGLTVALGRRLPHVSYAYRGISKRVDYWAARVDGAALPFAPGDEVDRFEWLTAEQAGARLSYPHDVELLAEFSAGPLETVPFILLRHASAGRKSDWPADDIARPLDAQGTAEAEDLAGLLHCFGVAGAVSSPAERCLATVRPYASAVGADIAAEDAFLPAGESEFAAADAAAAMARLAAAGEPVIVCAHRENLPVLVEAACDQLQAVPPGGPRLHKAEFLVLHASAGKLAAAERHQARALGLALHRPR